MNEMLMENTETAAEDSSVTHATSLVKRLRQAIMTGELAPGTKLRLDALRAQLGLTISRSPLREALSRLGAEGLVLIEDGRGYRVIPVSEKNLQEIAKLRIHSESLALREAIAKGDQAWLDGIEAAEDRLREIKRSDNMAPNRQETWEEAHRHFHMKLLEACDMPLLLSHCNTLHDLNDRYRRLFLAKNPFDRDVNAEHAGIVSATLERNADLACALLAQHIQRTTQNICRSLCEQYPDTP
ncbi:MAG: HTH-type transcriptional regulator McbR [Pseudomonas sp.]|nr:MAG: HTH-type transcriptional regulator McbR [Pseudomonas sp.]